MMTKKQKHFGLNITTDTSDKTRRNPPRFLLAKDTPILRHTRTMDEHNKDTAAPDVVPEASAQDSTAEESSTQDNTAEESSTQDNTALEVTSSKSSAPHSNRTGWDGKLRLNSEKQAVLANPEALENSDYEDDDAPPVDQIAADEGAWA
jgi:hypothetical protein